MNNTRPFFCFLIRVVKRGFRTSFEINLTLVVFLIISKLCKEIGIAVDKANIVGWSVSLGFHAFQPLIIIALANFVRGRSMAPDSTPVAPPVLAEFLLGLFAARRFRQGLLQCLAEDFQDDLLAGMSLTRAKLRYWAAALNSIGPQLWAAIRRIGIVGILADYVRGKLGGA